MASWSKRRRLIYGGIVIVFVAAAIIVPGFFLFYKAPTCFDGVRNGSEQGVDCGGSCQKLCASAFKSPSVSWARSENVVPGLYNIAAYVINPNADGEARNVPYHMGIYDDHGTSITDITGTMTLPSNRNTLAFQGTVNVAKQIPARILFEFTGAPDWNKRADPLAALSIVGKDYSEDGAGSSLTVTLKNASVNPLPRMTVYAVLYDQDGNAIGFSRTVVDGIAPQGTAVAPYTWPQNRHGKVISIEILPVAE